MVQSPIPPRVEMQMADPNQRIEAPTALLVPADKLIITAFLVFVLGLFALFCSHIAYIFGHPAWCDSAEWIGWGGVVVCALFIAGALAVNASAAICPVFIGGISCIGNDKNAAAAKTANRRQYTLLVILLATAVSLTVHGLSEALRLPGVKRVTVRIDGLPVDLEGITIVQLTDLHISTAIRRNRVQQIVARVNALAPDIVALTGDVADDRLAAVFRETAPLAGISARLGKFFVTGNHEYYHGDEEWTREMEKLGYVALSNTNCRLAVDQATLLVGGVPDYRGAAQYGQTSSPARAMDGGGADVSVLLAHEPISVYEAAAAGFDLQLSGHTHGGQFGPARWLASLMQPFQSGLYAYGRTQVYVSNGVGYWGLPLRFGAPAEISHLTLTGTGPGSASIRVDQRRKPILDSG
jgi:predicted MPP superfamily phosphohydrolase